VGARWIASAEPVYGVLLTEFDTELIGFEPDEQECEALARRYRGHRAQFHAQAIGSGGPGCLRLCEVEAKSSLYEPNTALTDCFTAFGHGMEVVGTRDLETVTLDFALGDIEIDLLVMDVQGSEYDVIENGHRSIESALVVQTEVKFVAQYTDQMLFGDIDRALRAKGLMFHTILGYGTRAVSPLVVEGDPLKGVNQWLWADVVYVRDILSLDDLSPERLVKLAVICDVCYSSYDFSYKALSLAGRRTGDDSAARYLAALSGADTVGRP
jgi:FkbM family methyltransferase